MPYSSQFRLLQTDPRISRALERREDHDGAVEASFQSKAQRWQTSTKAAVALLSLVSGGLVPLGLWLSGAFKRRMVVQPEGAAAGHRGISLGLKRSEWKEVQLLAASRPGAHGRSDAAARAREMMTRELAFRVIRTAARDHPKHLEELEPALQGMSTRDLARTARLVAGGKAEVLDDIRHVRDREAQDSVPVEVWQHVQDFRAHQTRFDRMVHIEDGLADNAPAAGPADAPGAAAPAPAPGGLARVAQSAQQAAVRELAAELIYARTSADMSELDDQGHRIRKLLVEHAPTLALLAREPDIAVKAGLPESLQDELLKQLPRALMPSLLAAGQSLKVDDIRRALQAAPVAAFREIHGRIDAAISKLDFNRIGAEEGRPGPLSSLEMPGMEDSGLGIFFKAVFARYFNEQTTLDKRAMLASCLRESTVNDPPERQLLALIKGTGPYMLKVLQLLGDHAPPDLAAVLAAVKSELTPLDPTMRKALLAKMVNDINGDPQNPYRISSIGPARVLGAASVGEAMSADLVLVSRDPAKANQYPERKERVVIKLLRPGVELRAARDREFFMKVAQEVQKGMPGTIRGIADQIDAELDLRNEARFVKEGACYTQDIHRNVQAMRLASIAAPAKDYMLIERAPGSTVKHYTALLEPGAQGRRKPNFNPVEIGARLDLALGNLADIWLQEMLFKSGFFHGDLHSGNMMFDGDSGQLTVIDFGNAGRLNKAEQRSVLLMGVSASARLSTIFEREFKNLLSEQSRAQLAQPDARDATRTKGDVLRERIRGIIKETDLLQVADEAERAMRKSPADKINRVLHEAQQLGLEIPQQLANVSRSLLMLETTMESVNRFNKANKPAEITRLQALEQSLSDQVEHAEVELETKKVIAKTVAVLDAMPPDQVSQLNAGQYADPLPIDFMSMPREKLWETLVRQPPLEKAKLLSVREPGNILSVLFPEEMEALNGLRAELEKTSRQLAIVKSTGFAENSLGDAVISAGSRNWFRALRLAPQDVTHSLFRMRAERLAQDRQDGGGDAQMPAPSAQTVEAQEAQWQKEELEESLALERFYSGEVLLESAPRVAAARMAPGDDDLDPLFLAMQQANGKLISRVGADEP